MRAYELIDYANSLIDKEMDSDYEEQCKEIIKARDERNAAATLNEDKASISSQEPASSTVSGTVNVTPLSNLSQSQPSPTSNGTSSKPHKRRSSSWSKGIIASKRPVRRLQEPPTVRSEIETEIIKEESKKSQSQVSDSPELLEVRLDSPPTAGDHHVSSKFQLGCTLIRCT